MSATCETKNIFFSCSEFRRAIEAAEAGGSASLSFGLSAQQAKRVNRYIAAGGWPVRRCGALVAITACMQTTENFQLLDRSRRRHNSSLSPQAISFTDFAIKTTIYVITKALAFWTPFYYE